MCNIAEPKSGLEAKFSLRFNAALALHGVDTSDIAAYDDAIVLRPELEAIRAITTVELASPGWPEDVTEVRVETVDGRLLVASHDVSEPAGDLTVLTETLRTKFLNLVEPRLDATRARDLMSGVTRLAELDDLGALMARTR
jgi:hypothetical protein